MDTDDSQPTSISTRLTFSPLGVGVVGLVLYILLSLSACGSKKGDVLKSDIDTLEYTSMTRGVETLISDSGVTRYKLQAELWYTYSYPQRKWYFPAGIYVEQFDTLFTIEASVKADTAYFYEDKELWYLVGNVEILSREGQRFYAHTFYWDQYRREIYSHDHVRIIKAEGQEINGKYGFKSNQEMTRYEIYSSYGHLDIDKEAMAAPADSLSPPSPTAP